MPHATRLFEPFTLRSVTLRNRIVVSPMCQYSVVDGMVGDWHLVHLGARAVGGAGLVLAEATAVADIGRISPADTGLWKDDQIDPWRRINRFIDDHGAVPGVQLAHAGWKASTQPPWEGHHAVLPEKGGWQPVSVSDRAFAEGYAAPHKLSTEQIDELCTQWRDATRRAIEAGFRLIEIHAAHGYLLHSFCSPLSNDRTDGYGGSFENRTRLLLRIARETRDLVGDDFPLFVRLSCTDWVEGGWTIEDSIRVAGLLREEAGIDLIDCSSGGAAPSARIPVGPGYQAQFAQAIRQKAKIATGAVGMITDAVQAETILRTGQAELILVARELLRDPYWPARAARKLGAAIDELAPNQYLRAW